MSRILLSCLVLFFLGLSMNAGAIVLHNTPATPQAATQIKKLNAASDNFLAEAEIDEDEDCGHNHRIHLVKRSFGQSLNALRCLATAIQEQTELPIQSKSSPPPARYLLLCQFRM